MSHIWMLDEWRRTRFIFHSYTALVIRSLSWGEGRTHTTHVLSKQFHKLNIAFLLIPHHFSFSHTRSGQETWKKEPWIVIVYLSRSPWFLLHALWFLIPNKGMFYICIVYDSMCGIPCKMNRILSWFEFLAIHIHTLHNNYHLHTFHVTCTVCVSVWGTIWRYQMQHELKCAEMMIA